ncbi:hypothetical protein FQN60_007563 [Etheostoma spectabile]|uniref:Uncharacterized protein n=1 Tax=Etheostoma spectabile TaxID=54343 RepID=A0A5J5CXW6_9PERO|nr:hypothetical protein FQN60_007563 [Etheostoma spectabile]
MPRRKSRSMSLAPVDVGGSPRLSNTCCMAGWTDVSASWVDCTAGGPSTPGCPGGITSSSSRTPLGQASSIAVTIAKPSFFLSAAPKNKKTRAKSPEILAEVEQLCT